VCVLIESDIDKGGIDKPDKQTKNKMIMHSRDDNNDRCIIAVLTDSYNHSTNYASTYLVPAMHLYIIKS